jgi:hypothetical protein
LAAVFTGQCEGNVNGKGNNGKGNGKGNGNGNGGDNTCQSKIYVPLTTTSTEPGGIGVYGQIP